MESWYRVEGHPSPFSLGTLSESDLKSGWVVLPSSLNFSSTNYFVKFSFVKNLWIQIPIFKYGLYELLFSGTVSDLTFSIYTSGSWSWRTPSLSSFPSSPVETVYLVFQDFPFRTLHLSLTGASLWQEISYPSDSPIFHMPFTDSSLTLPVDYIRGKFFEQSLLFKNFYTNKTNPDPLYFKDRTVCPSLSSQTNSFYLTYWVPPFTDSIPSVLRDFSRPGYSFVRVGSLERPPSWRSEVHLLGNFRSPPMTPSCTTYWN